MSIPPFATKQERILLAARITDLEDLVRKLQARNAELEARNYDLEARNYDLETQNTQPSSPVWENVYFASRPTPRFFAQSITYNEKIYTFGGSSNGHPISMLECYDCKTQQLATLTPIPSPRCGMALVTAGEFILCIGGIDIVNGTEIVSNKVEAYRVSTNNWYSVASLPSPRAYCSAVFLNNLVYCIGGLGRSDIAVFDPHANKWNAETIPLPDCRFLVGAVSHAGKILIVGGGIDPDATSTPIITFDPANMAAPFSLNGLAPSINVNSHGLVIVNNHLYLIGGNLHRHASKLVQSLNLTDETATWTEELPLPTDISAFSVAHDDHCIYCIYGKNEASVGLSSFLKLRVQPD